MTSVAKANGQATQVALKAVAPVAAAPVAPASPLQKVGERVFNLNLGGSAPAVAAVQTSEDASDTQADVAPLAMAPTESTNVVRVNQFGERIDTTDNDAQVTASAPAMPAIKVVRKAPAPVVRAKAPKVEELPIAKAVQVGDDAVISDTVITFDEDEVKQTVAELRDEPVREVKKPVVAKAKPVAKVAVAKRAAKAPVVKAPVARVPVAKAPMVKKKRVVAKKPVVVRSVRGMVIVASTPRLASKVSNHLAGKGLRASRLGKPNKQLTPLTEIHYRSGYEADVAAVSKALPVRAYPIELTGLPAGVNIKVVVGNDIKRKL